jgi:hypothetical protein
MSEPVCIDIETIPADKSQIDLYKSIKCKRCEHNPELHPKQKKDYCGECDGDSALRWPTAQTVCITAKVVGGETYCFCDKDEFTVLSQAYDLFAEINPRPWIGFNVKEFDIVHLVMRGLVNHVPMIDILPTAKYDKNVVDLYDRLVGGKWNKQQSATLEMFSAMLGFKDLLYGNGGQVGTWYLNDQLDEIKRHNIGDVLATEMLYLCVENVGSSYKKLKMLKKEDDVEETISI